MWLVSWSIFRCAVANQQSMIGCLETKVRLSCEPEKVVLEVWWMRCTWSNSCRLWEHEIFDVGWTELCHYRCIRSRMMCLCIFLWIKSELCCHSRSCVLRDRCTIEVRSYKLYEILCLGIVKFLWSIEGEWILRSWLRSVIGIMVCKSVCCASRVSIVWWRPLVFGYTLIETKLDEYVGLYNLDGCLTIHYSCCMEMLGLHTSYAHIVGWTWMLE